MDNNIEIIDNNPTPVEPAPKKNKKGIIILVVLMALIILGLVGYILYDKGIIFNSKEEVKEEEKIDKDETKVKDEEEKYVAVGVSDNNDEIVLLNNSFEKTWKYSIKDKQNSYRIMRIDEDYLYYVDGDNLYRMNINDEKVEDLDIKMDGYWFFSVDGEDLIYDELNTIYYINLNDKTKTKLPIAGNNQNVVLNGYVFYTSTEDQSLRAYSLKDKQSEELEDTGRIIEYGKDSILYINGKNQYVVYNVVNKTKDIVLQGGEYAFQAGEDYPVKLFNNKAYYVDGDSLKILGTDSDKEVYKYKLKENEKIFDFILLSNKKILLMIFASDGKGCESETCGPSGDTKFVLVDIDKNKSKEIEKNLEFIMYDGDYDIQYCY